MNNNKPFSKKPSFNAVSINKLQIETDEIDEETRRMIDQKSIEQLTNENAVISQEIDKLNEEFSDYSQKSNDIELLLRSQQQCILLINKDNEELKEIADQTEQRLMSKSSGKHKKSKNIKESELFDQIRYSIEKQNSLTQKAISTIDNDLNLQKIIAIRKKNLLLSKNQLSNFDQIIIKRHNLIERYKEYINETTNHTKRNLLFKEYEDLINENKELTDRYSVINKQKQILENKKKKLADIENSIKEIDLIKEDTKKIEEEIENKKTYSDFSQIFYHDAQFTESQSYESQLYNSVGCVTDSPRFAKATEKDLRNLIDLFENKISQIKKEIDIEGTEIIKMAETIRDQHKEIYLKVDLMIKNKLKKFKK